MEDLIDLLNEEMLTCIIRQNQNIYKESANGIQPILNFLKKGQLKDAQVVDKVIGKAAAMMMVYGGVKEVYTHIISEHALHFFEEHKVTICYKEKVPYIINRKKDGMCPMEECVLTCDNMEKAYHLLHEKIKAMQKNS